ncbi:MAG TPA: redoxin family protein [Candidatus Baltobacteraceae bacterium]|jgi:thiol-disulfide isomerase/thioredoxin
MKHLFIALTALFLISALPAVSLASSPATLQPLLTAGRWYNGRLDPASVRGKVVLIDVFTVDCFNCRNVTPELRKLRASQTRNGLVIAGVHSPETSWEKNPQHVVSALKDLGVDWPVAVDDDFAIWRAYGVNAWPTQLIFDRHGRLHATIVGDSQDALVQRTVERLLAQR